jgi:hypothetical protein
MELATELLSAFRQQLRQASTLSLDRGEPLEAMIGVPANANSNQRFLTAEAFRAAGFQVLGMLNEPSAASVEFGHREHAQRKGQPRRSLLVYDLGGGTFDASLVEMEEDTHTVVASAGLSDLGGDDFDEILANLALETAGRAGERESLSDAESFRLLEECRERKESLNPNTRRIVVDLERVREGWGEVSIAVAPYYELCRPLVERTAEVVEGIARGASRPAHRNALCDRRRLRASRRGARAQGDLRAGPCGAPPTCARPPPSASPSAPMRAPAMCCATGSQVTSACGARPTTAAPWPSICSSRAAWSCRARRAAVACGALLSAGPQHRPLPLRGSGAHRRGRPALGRPHVVGRHPVSLRPALRGAGDLTLVDVSRKAKAPAAKWKRNTRAMPAAS